MSQISKKSKVMIAYGSENGESDVSKGSAENVFKALGEAGYKDVVVCEISRSNIFPVMEKEMPEVVFNAMHGGFGEDGHLPAILNMLKIPYTHSGVSASMLCMDKILTHGILSADKIKMPNFISIKFDDMINGGVFDLIKQSNLSGQKFIIKPASSGSSIGVVLLDMLNNAMFRSDLQKVLETKLFSSQDDFLVEEMIFGREFDVVVVERDGKLLAGLFEISFDGEFFSYQGKYSPDSRAKKIYNPCLSHGVSEKIKETAIKIHKMLGCRDLSRSEFKMDEKTGEIYTLEINTHPGISDASFVPKFLSISNIKTSDVFSDFLMNAKYE